MGVIRGRTDGLTDGRTDKQTGRMTTALIVRMYSISFHKALIDYYLMADNQEHESTFKAFPLHTYVVCTPKVKPEVAIMFLEKLARQLSFEILITMTLEGNN